MCKACARVVKTGATGSSRGADTKQTTDARPRPRLLIRRLRGHACRHCCTSSSKQRCTACTAPAARTSQAFVHRRVVRALQMVRNGDPPRSSERGGGLRHAGWMATVDAPVAPKYWNERNQLKAPIARAPTPSLPPPQKRSGSHRAVLVSIQCGCCGVASYFPMI